MRLHLPHHRYECTGCGRCCRANWSILVEAAAEPAIRNSRAYQEKTRAGYRPLKVVSERLTISRDAENSCLFLTRDMICEIHAELGSEAKPIVCQTYPYLFTQTPDGIYTALSYACPAVLEQSGSWVESQRPALEFMLESRWNDIPTAESVGDRIEVRRGHQISWSDYLELEARILEAVSPDDPVGSLLTVAVNLLLDARSLSSPYNLGGFDRELLTMVSCNLLAVTEDGVTDPVERAQLGSLLWNGGGHFSSKLGVELRDFRLLRPSRPELGRQINAYLRQAILGKRLLSGTVVSRLLALSCGLSIMLFYQRALGQNSDSDEAQQAATDRAFTLVESELLTHTRSFDGFFLEFEDALTGVRDALR